MLTDIRMPKMNGFALYQKIKEIDKNIKVHFLTASEINYDEFKEKVAPTIYDTQTCFSKIQSFERPSLDDSLEEMQENGKAAVASH